MTLALLIAVRVVLAPQPCAHAPSDPRPRVTAAEQLRARRSIDAAIRLTGGSADFRRLLLLVATRESSLQPGVVHRLPADIEASAAAWRQTRAYYARAGNPHADDADRWQTYGLYGLSGPYHLRAWDPRADPRVLCDAAVSTLTYRRAAVRLLRKLSSAPCRRGQAITWAVLHTAVARGKLCAAPSEDFRRRALQWGLDPDRRVRQTDLGRESEPQEILAAKIRATQ